MSLACVHTVAHGETVTRRQAMTRLQDSFAVHGIASAALDARVLVCSCGGFSFEEYVRDADAMLSLEQFTYVKESEERRLSGEPVSRILGVRAFWDHDFLLSAETLDPRADTETLVEAALWAVQHTEMDAEKLLIGDLGTGTGCILISLLCELRQAVGLGIDISLDALRTAHKNAQRAGVEHRAGFVLSDWGASLRGGFDVIVANPPYIRRDEIDLLSPEVAQFDPRRALDGGEDGLSAYREISPLMPTLLKAGGVCLFEVGAGQAECVLELFSKVGLDVATDWASEQVFYDLGGHLRVVAAQQRS